MYLILIMAVALGLLSVCFFVPELFKLVSYCFQLLLHLNLFFEQDGYQDGDGKSGNNDCQRNPWPNMEELLHWFACGEDHFGADEKQDEADAMLEKAE